MKKENIYNIPNLITLLRVIMTIVLIFLIFNGLGALGIAILFAVTALTDFFDGWIARGWKQTTEFGRKFDMIADRFLMIGTIMALLIHSKLNGFFTKYHILQVVLVLMRELLSTPVVLFKKGFPHVKYVGKVTTFMQGVTFPLIILSVSYPFFNFSIWFAIATAIVGAYSALVYIKQ